MNLLDLVTCKDENGQKCFSLTELSCAFLLVIPTVMGIISFVLWCVRKEPVWPGLPDFCLQAYGAGVGIKVGKGVVGNVNSYYSNRPAYIQRPVDYSSQNGGTK